MKKIVKWTNYTKHVEKLKFQENDKKETEKSPINSKREKIAARAA